MIESASHRAAIVLAGGQSRRMGSPKAWLPFGNQTLLTRVLHILDPLVKSRIVVAAEDQDLPTLPADVVVARDRFPDRGPLEGIRTGLEASGGGAELFYVSSCDAPLLRQDFVEGLFEMMSPDVDIIVPRDDRHYHPLAAVYRYRVLDRVTRLLEADRLRPFFLFEQAKTKEVSVEQLRRLDPALDSLRNLNTPSDYEQALRDAGLSP